MGKGDKKTKKGKIHIGSFGVSRSRKAEKAKAKKHVVPAKAKKESSKPKAKKEKDTAKA